MTVTVAKDNDNEDDNDDNDGYGNGNNNGDGDDDGNNDSSGDSNGDGNDNSSGDGNCDGNGDGCNNNDNNSGSSGGGGDDKNGSGYRQQSIKSGYCNSNTDTTTAAVAGSRAERPGGDAPLSLWGRLHNDSDSGDSKDNGNCSGDSKNDGAAANDNQCYGSGRGKGGEDYATGGGLGPTTPFNLKRTNCRVLLSLLGAGLTPMLEVLLRAFSIIALSFESAALAAGPVDNGIQSAAASANREELGRAEQRIWGDNPDALRPPMQMGIPSVLASSPFRVSGAAWQWTGPPPMALVLTSCCQWTMV